VSIVAQPGNGGQDDKDWIDKVFLPLIGQLGLDPLQQEFLRNRWLDQVRFAENKAGKAQWWYRRLRLITIIGGVIIPALVGLNVTGSASQAIRWAVFGLGLAVALAASIEGFFNYGDRWPHYRRLAELLKSEGWQFFQLSGPYAGTVGHAAAYPQFCARVEEIIQRDVEVFFTSVATGKTQQAEPDHAGQAADRAGRAGHPAADQLPETINPE
jgi:hypothetical protein